LKANAAGATHPRVIRLEHFSIPPILLLRIARLDRQLCAPRMAQVGNPFSAAIVKKWKNGLNGQAMDVMVAFHGGSRCNSHFLPFATSC
jgi:hypothetical protein